MKFLRIKSSKRRSFKNMRARISHNQRDHMRMRKTTKMRKTCSMISKFLRTMKPRKFLLTNQKNLQYNEYLRHCL